MGDKVVQVRQRVLNGPMYANDTQWFQVGKGYIVNQGSQRVLIGSMY